MYDVTKNDVRRSEINDELIELDFGEEKEIAGHKIKHTNNDMYIVDDAETAIYYHQVLNILSV